MSGHTPGKWTVIADAIIANSKEPGERLIAVMNWRHVPEDNANARLIAEAPETKAQRDELLEACKALVDYRKRAGALSFQLEKADYWINKMAEAIDKAEGKTP